MSLSPVFAKERLKHRASRARSQNQAGQRGFGLPVAVFVITVMALLGAAMVNLVATGSHSVSLEMLSLRAFYAAESGAQRALTNLFPPAGGAASCPASSTLNFNQQGLAGCSAVVSCSSRTINTRTYFTVISSGSCGAGNDLVSRRVEVGATDI